MIMSRYLLTNSVYSAVARYMTRLGQISIQADLRDATEFKEYIADDFVVWII